MSLLSIEFGCLFPVFLLIYWLLRTRPALQNKLLLLASYGILLSFHYYFALVIGVYTVVIYVLSCKIHQHPDKNKWFTVAIIAAILNLGIFKYFDFFRDTIQTLINTLNLTLLLPGVEIIMPLGISFYTFHSVSYLVSIKKREITLPPFLDFALFLSFFPSLIAGPINRAKVFLPQIQVSEPRKIGDPSKAYILLIVALIKVLWLSPVLAENWVDPVFASPKEFHALDALTALYLYAIQLYLNFSGYTDLVTAIAILLGFTLPINFNTPYLAHNLRDFWQRWHISLSSWIKDYIYIPLGGSRQGFTRTQFNLMAAMLISGLWHGASYNFIIWGAIHGAGVVLLNIGDKLFGKELLTRQSKFLATFITFQYTSFAWLFFRCPTFDSSMDYLSALSANYYNTPMHFNSVFGLGCLLLLFICYPFIATLPERATRCLHKTHWSIRPVILALVIWLIISLSPSGIPGFIYSNF